VFSLFRFVKAPLPCLIVLAHSKGVLFEFFSLLRTVLPVFVVAHPHRPLPKLPVYVSKRSPAGVILALLKKRLLNSCLPPSS